MQDQQFCVFVFAMFEQPRVVPVAKNVKTNKIQYLVTIILIKSTEQRKIT